MDTQIVLGDTEPRELFIAGKNRLLITEEVFLLDIDAFLEEVPVVWTNLAPSFQGAVAGQLWVRDGVNLSAQDSTQKRRPLWKVTEVSAHRLTRRIPANVSPS